MSNHGRARGQVKQFWPDMVGFKYKMSNIQAALGCAQMERIDELVDRKRKIFSKYSESLANFRGVSMNPEPPGTINGARMPTVVFSCDTGVSREQAQSAFARENIDARVFFWPLSGMPMFKKNQSNYWSLSIPSRAINLPSYHDISLADQMRVINVIDDLCDG